MSQEKYFREELEFLREQGKAFTEIHPQLSRFLNGRNIDPDVERLLEGFAFLTGKLREKIEDELPELTHSMINMLWPNYLRPVPSLSIVKFAPNESVSVKHIIKAGVSLNSRKVHGTICQFQTCRDVALYPVECVDISAQHTREASTIELNFEIGKGLTIHDIDLDSLRFYLGGDKISAEIMYLWINHYLDSIDIDYDGTQYRLNKDALSLVGFDKKEALLPYPKNVYDGYRIIQEYLTFSEAFNFIDIKGLNQALPSDASGGFLIKLNFNKTIDTSVRISKELFQLYCTPIINLFDHDADPIDLTGLKTEYKIIPSGTAKDHYEVFSINEVAGWRHSKNNDTQVKGGKRVYSEFESFQHEVERVRNREALYYRARVRESLKKDGFDRYISFVRGDESSAYNFDEAVSIKLTCTNRQLPNELGLKDIKVPTDSSPTFASFENITIPTPPLRPVLDGSLLWTLISNLSLNYLSLLSKDALSSIIRAYDFKALVNRQAEQVSKQRMNGILSVTTEPTDRIIYGMAVRGLKSVIELDSDCFSSEGSLYQFGTVLSRFFSLYASINSFHELVVINSNNREVYTWGIQDGMQPLI
ncbi:type VI secretion system baseplate subunit TssF [Marinomonas sp. THO17]|uniref:type VI secretion system baseplate subunit TssF n=1 Tax=Marinomonas sp. THO17 TaxID=3149048 RepID=UPI00336BCADD